MNQPRVETFGNLEPVFLNHVKVYVTCKQNLYLGNLLSSQFFLKGEIAFHPILNPKLS